MSDNPALQRMASADPAAGLAGGPAWAERRRAALATLLREGLPGRGDENWKYLDHRRLAELDFTPRAATGSEPAALPQLPVPGAICVNLVNGRFAGRRDSTPAEGLQVDSLAALLATGPDAMLERVRRPGDEADDRYALMADALAADGVVVRVAAGASPPPLLLTHACDGQRPGASHSRVAIEVGRGARLQLIEHFVTPGDAAAVSNLAGELRLEEGAELDHIRVLQLGTSAAHVETLVGQQLADSRYRQQLYVLGGGIVRSNFRLALAGERATGSLAGLFIVDGRRQADLYALVEHLAPRTRTDENFRGIAADRGRGAFNGRIVVHPEARGADSRQSSRNLLLTPLAEINARPQLEILTDEVQCRHGATVGSLDPAQLFYLLSRGIDPQTARGLLVFAFCEDVIAGLGTSELRHYIEDLVVGRLPDGELIRSFR